VLSYKYKEEYNTILSLIFMGIGPLFDSKALVGTCGIEIKLLSPLILLP